MLSGKKFPQNICMLRMVAEELVRKVLIENNSPIRTMSELLSVLEEKATHSRTSKLWLDNLIKPVLIMMLFVRAEREGNWHLHLYAVSEMNPYFFAAGRLSSSWDFSTINHVS